MFGRLHQRQDFRQGLPRRFLADAQVDQDLRELGHHLPEFAQALVGVHHDPQNLKGGDQPIPCGGEIAENQMATLLAADVQVVGQHFLQNISVADLGADDLAAGLPQRKVEAEIAHYGGDQRILFQFPAPEPVECGDTEDIVAVHECPGFVAEQDPVAIAVVGNANVGSELAGRFTNHFGKEGTAFFVDVGAVGHIVENGDARAQLAENTGSAFIGRAMPGIHHDAQAFEIHPFRERGLRILHIPAQRIVNADGFADFLGGRANVFNGAAEDQIFNFRLDIVIQFIAVVLEKFDAIVFVWIVGRGEDDSRIRPERPGNVRHAGGR